jgi:hypothetical protein
MVTHAPTNATSSTDETDVNAVREFMKYLSQPGEVREIRIPDVKRDGPTRLYRRQSGYVDCPDKAAAALKYFTPEDAEAVFVTLNPVNPALLSRAQNRLVDAKSTTGDADIVARRHLLIDCDPNRPTGISSTATEMQAACQRRDEVRAALTELYDWPNPGVSMMSGNGAALLYRIDLPNDDDATHLVSRVLTALDTFFSDEQVTIDTSVSNASRLTKIAGTFAAKGDPSEERPWRQALATYPENAAVVSRELLEIVAGEAPLPPPAPATRQPATASHQNRQRPWSMQELLATNGLQATSTHWNRGMVYTLDRCLTSEDHTDGARLIEMSSGAIAYRCHHARCQDKGWAYLREHGLIIIPNQRPTEMSPNGKTASTVATMVVQATDANDGAETGGVTIDHFFAYMPDRSYLFTPTNARWTRAGVVAKLGPLAATWLDKTRAVEAITWAPGQPTIIEGQLLADGGWIDHPGARTFNTYRPATLSGGRAERATPWLDLVQTLYPDDADHLVQWFAYRVQRPDIKINHSLLLGGGQGIGKDSVFAPVRSAVGAWNVSEVSPVQLMGRFNGFLASVILRVSEVGDLGDATRFSLYEHLKTFTAAPPEALRIDQKNAQEYLVPNLVGVVMTSNHKLDSLYLPSDDRRTYVAWSDKTAGDFGADYWRDYHRWLESGGYADVATYLHELDLSAFDPKAPPPKTIAFWEIVDAGRSAEDGELADALDALGQPAVVTLADIITKADTSFEAWLRDRKHRRQVPHRLEAAGYTAARNPYAADGLWKIRGSRQMIYARRELSVRARLDAIAERFDTAQQSFPIG